MKKIYIIDDDRNIVESLTIVLNSEGYETSSQYDDENVLENVLSNKPDLIILDVMFPEDESAGFKIARNLRNHDLTKNIPILILSAINEKGEYSITFSNNDIDDSYLPVDEFIEKPITPKDLLEKIKSTLDK